MLGQLYCALLNDYLSEVRGWVGGEGGPTAHAGGWHEGLDRLAVAAHTRSGPLPTAPHRIPPPPPRLI